MKKKLLVFLLVICMLVGMTFTFAACGQTEEYENYFKSVYSSLKDEEDIRLQTITYVQLQQMYVTAGGKFLVYFGGHWDTGTQNSIKGINDLAKEYNVPAIYNFDPKLDGGWGAKQGFKTNFATPLDYNADLTSAGVGSVSTNFGRIQAEIVSIFGNVPLNKLVYFEGGDVNAAGYTCKNSVKIAGVTEISAGVTYTNATLIKSTCDTVPNRGTNSNAYFSLVTPFYYFSDMNFHIVDPLEVAVPGTTETVKRSDYLTDSGSIFQTITYHEFLVMLGYTDYSNGIAGDFLVHFGGNWCPNTQAMAWLCDKWGKDYGLDKIFLFDPKLDGGTGDMTKGDRGKVPNPSRPTSTMWQASYEVNIRTNDVDIADTADVGTYVGTGTKVGFSYTALYADLLMALGGKFTSGWNTPEFTTNYTIKFDTTKYTWYTGVKLTRENDTATYIPRMCVPNIMLLNNAKDGEFGKIIAKVEVEYLYDNTSVASNPYRKYLDAALEDLISKHQYAVYAPPSSGGSSDSGASAPAASGGGDAC